MNAQQNIDTGKAAMLAYTNFNGVEEIMPTSTADWRRDISTRNQSAKNNLSDHKTSNSESANN